jgi:hypothetical protein
MDELNSAQKNNLKKNVNKILSKSITLERLATKIGSEIFDLTTETNGDPVNLRTIKIVVWAIPLPNKPEDTDPLNYYRIAKKVEIEYLSPPIGRISDFFVKQIIADAIAPVYDNNDDFLRVFLSRTIKEKKIIVNYKLTYPTFVAFADPLDSDPLPCKIIIPFTFK